jgi:tryptophan synthase beta chain
VEYTRVPDVEALDAFVQVTRLEGIVPALESAHAFVVARREAALKKGSRILVCLSGRGDKDVAEVARLLELPDV